MSRELYQQGSLALEERVAEGAALLVDVALLKTRLDHERKETF
jgi:hypothetical protein